MTPSREFGGAEAAALRTPSGSKKIARLGAPARGNFVLLLVVLLLVADPPSAQSQAQRVVNIGVVVRGPPPRGRCYGWEQRPLL